MSATAVTLRLGQLEEIEYLTFTERKTGRLITYSAYSCPDLLRDFIEANADSVVEWREYGEMGDRRGQWQGYGPSYVGLIVWVKP